MKERFFAVLIVLGPALFLALAAAYLTLAVLISLPPSAHETYIRIGCTIALLGCGLSLVLAALLRKRVAWLMLFVPLAFCVGLLVYDSGQA